MSALSQVLAAGYAPYADFSVFGRYGKRMQHKMQFVAFQSLPDGTWQRQELPGPPNLSAWWASWRVFKTAMLLLEAVTPEVLEQYGDHIRDLVETYGEEVWWLVYLADTRMRGEEFPRLRRQQELIHDDRVTSHLPTSFNPQKPWDTVFAAAVSDKDFWQDNVREKAMLHKCRIKSQADLADDGTVQPRLRGAGHPLAGGPAAAAVPVQDTKRRPPPSAEPPPKTFQKAEERPLPARGADGLFEKNRKGIMLCDEFFRGSCSKSCRPSRSRAANAGI